MRPPWRRCTWRSAGHAGRELGAQRSTARRPRCNVRGMRSKILVWVGAGVIALGALGYGGFRVWRGSVGASSAYGGDIEAKTVGDFPTADAARWVNGEPASLAKLKGTPVLI